MFKVIKETEEFEKSLKEMEYLQGDSTDLLKYARDVNCHFASKKCKDVIVAARKLMTSKMHNTVKVCVSWHSVNWRLVFIFWCFIFIIIESVAHFLH